MLINFIFWQNIQYSFTNKINVYISGDDFYQKTASSIKKQSLMLHDTNVKNPIAKRDKFKFKKYSDTVDKATTAANNQQILQLVLYFHDLIQAQIEYPANIHSFLGNKKVYLSFVLFPDGHIEDIKIVQSSGIVIFDRAVLDAVSSLPRVTIAQEILKKPKEFNVPIEFF
jgi:TonB family protein